MMFAANDSPRASVPATGPSPRWPLRAPRMRIADVCEFYAPRGGGVKTYVRNRWKAAAKRGHEAIVIAPSSEDKVTELDGGRLVEIKAPAHPFDSKYHIFWDAAPVHAALDRIAPDLIEASSPWRGATVALNYPKPVPRTMFMHEEPIEKWAYGLFDRFLSRDTIDVFPAGWLWKRMRIRYAKSDAVICTADSVSSFLTMKGVERIYTIPLGVEEGTFSPRLRNRDLRARLLAQMGRGPDACLMLGSGRHNREKRWPIVMRALERINMQHQVGLLLIGHGPERRKIERLARDNPQILIMDPLDDRQAYAELIASADFLINAAIETFGLAAAEAIASGLPVVAEADGAVSTFAQPSFSEFFDAVDPGHIARAVDRLMKFMPQARAAARQAAETPRLLADHFDEIFELYGEVAARGHGHADATMPVGTFRLW